jgi:hypothetical protein
MINAAKVEATAKFYGTIEAAREAWRAVAKLAKNMGGYPVELTTYGQVVTEMTYLDQECDIEMGCPVHGSPVKKRYTFGMYEDAEVFTFKGCKCAVCVNTASLQCGVALGHELTYHGSYDSAHGRATLIKMQEAVSNAPFHSDM